MRSNFRSMGLVAAVALQVAAQESLDTVCTIEYVQSVLPAADYILGVVPNVDSVTANAVTNYTVSASSGLLGASGLDFCNVTFSYTHTGLGDTVSFLNLVDSRFS